MALGVVPRIGLLKWPFTVPYLTVPYPTALYRNGYQYVARVKTVPKCVFPYGIHVVLEVREEAVSWAPRGMVYVAVAENSKYRTVFVHAGKPHVDKLLTGSWPHKMWSFFLVG